MTAKAFTLLGFVAHLHAIDRDLQTVGPAIIARACEMVCTEAKRVLGEGYENWPPLSPATLAKKIGPGPLLETGRLRDSISWTAEDHQGWVGSNLDRAVWHELGTSRVPPRPFLRGAAMAMEDKIHKMAARAVVAVVAGRGLHSSELGELLHLMHTIKHAIHKAGEIADKVIDGPSSWVE